jgi:uncharacterized protein (TIGR02598 family)
MDILKHIDLSFKPTQRSRAAFSLVEIAICMGIISFAFFSLLGLIPMGMSTFRQAMETSVGSLIAQRVINDALQTDFDILTGTGTGPFVQKNRYFDDQGTELTTGTGAIYWVNTRINPTMATPSTSGSNANANLATITVQVVNDPSNQTPVSDATTKLWKIDPRFPLVTCSAIVSRNK